MLDFAVATLLLSIHPSVPDRPLVKTLVSNYMSPHVTPLGTWPSRVPSPVALHALPLLVIYNTRLPSALNTLLLYTNIMASDIRMAARLSYQKPNTTYMYCHPDGKARFLPMLPPPNQILSSTCFHSTFPRCNLMRSCLLVCMHG